MANNPRLPDVWQIGNLPFPEKRDHNFKNIFSAIPI